MSRALGHAEGEGVTPRRGQACRRPRLAHLGRSILIGSSSNRLTAWHGTDFEAGNPRTMHQTIRRSVRLGCAQGFLTTLLMPNLRTPPNFAPPLMHLRGPLNYRSAS